MLFIALIALCAQGSMAVLTSRPSTLAATPAGDRSWAPWCGRGEARADRLHLAYCARVEGIIIDSTRGPAPDEEHLAVICDFHLIVVHVVSSGTVPGVGARIVAVGPLVRARDGQREIQAFHLGTA